MTDHNEQLDNLQTQLNAWIDQQASFAKRQLLAYSLLRKVRLRRVGNEIQKILQQLAQQEVNNEFENSRLRLPRW